MAPRIVLDCRWLPFGGTGRLTELLLRGLAELRPTTTWVLWGPPDIERRAWPGSEIVVTSRDPRAGLGQRSWWELPASDLTVFMHQMRPLRPVPAVTVVLDTIPLRFARSPVERLSKQAFLKAAVALSRHVVTISEHSRRCIREDLGVAPERISVVRVPVDRDQAARVHKLRAAAAPEDVALYVGNFARHKNLPRLIEAFAGTDFCRTGGRLVLVGGSPPQIRELSGRLTPELRRFVDLVPRCGQAELEGMFARARFLVQPSLEEGFGLPVWEALASGLPVCASDGGALPEVLDGLVEPFPATSTPAMAAAIDTCARQARAGNDTGDLMRAAVLAAAATPRDLAEEFEGLARRALRT